MSLGLLFVLVVSHGIENLFNDMREGLHVGHMQSETHDGEDWEVQDGLDKVNLRYLSNCGGGWACCFMYRQLSVRLVRTQGSLVTVYLDASIR